MKKYKVQMGITLEPELRERIVERAKKEKRSLSNMCCYLFEEGLK